MTEHEHNESAPRFLTNEHILSMDEHVVAIDKPSGVLVHNSAYAGPKEHSLRMDVGLLLQREAWPLHRLDRPTSGVTLFMLDRPSIAAWQECMQHEDTEKTYLAWVHGHVPTDIEVIDHHVRVAKDQKKDAITEVIDTRHLIAEDGTKATRLRLRLQTGRKHQIRQHMKHIRHPMLGDTTWGRGAINRPLRESVGLHRLALHAESLQLTDPSGRLREFRSPLANELERIFGDNGPFRAC